mmetsp:Transcript_81384/g.143652  ORF Transcript_81384/g.143652 Transcript_81384/m.143652 type:complete len:239 (-) Transcript_81384:296-1012(-)
MERAQNCIVVNLLLALELLLLCHRFTQVSQCFPDELCCGSISQVLLQDAAKVRKRNCLQQAAQPRKHLVGHRRRLHPHRVLAMLKICQPLFSDVQEFYGRNLEAHALYPLAHGLHYELQELHITQILDHLSLALVQMMGSPPSIGVLTVAVATVTAVTALSGCKTNARFTTDLWVTNTTRVELSSCGCALLVVCLQVWQHAHAWHAAGITRGRAVPHRWQQAVLVGAQACSLAVLLVC